MILNLIRLDDAQLQALHALPEGIHDLVGQQHQGQFDLDKAWHGVHYLLTQSAWGGEPPLNFLIGGGEQVGEENVGLGYGPARSIEPAEVSRIHAALSQISEDDFRQGYDPQAMLEAEIYPQMWEEDGGLDYLLDNFRFLKNSIAKAATVGQGLLLFLT